MRSRLLTAISTTLLLLGTLSARGQDAAADRVMNELAMIDAHKLAHVAFRVAEKSSEADRVYSVRVREEDDEEMTLLLVEGREPTDKERKAFATEIAENKKKEAEQGDEEGAVHMDSLSEMVEPGSLTLVQTDGPLQTFEFRPHIDMGGKEAPKELLGRIHFNSETGHLVSLEIVSTKPFKPDFKVKLKEFRMGFHFERVPGFEVVLPVRIESHVKGSAMMVMSFDETYVMELSDYVRIEE